MEKIKAKIVSIRKRLWGLWWTMTFRLESGEEIVIRSCISPFYGDTEELAIGTLRRHVSEKITKKEKVNDRARIKKAIGEEIEVEVKGWEGHPSIELVTSEHWAKAKFDGRRKLTR